MTTTVTEPAARAIHRYARVSPSKVRVVLDLIRGKSVADAYEILAFSERAVSDTIMKVLHSAVSNAADKTGVPFGDIAPELYVSACYADEGPTLKRWRPRARGRATRIRKRTSHITVIVTRYDADELAARRARDEARGGTASTPSESRRRRVARSRGDEAEDSSTMIVGGEAVAVDAADAADGELHDELEDTTPAADAAAETDDAASADDSTDAASDDSDTETENS